MELAYLGHKFCRNREGMAILATNDSPEGAYYAWFENKPHKQRRIVDILSDGVLRQKEYSFYFESASGDANIPPMNTDMVNIYSSVIFDSNFFAKVGNAGIHVNLFDRHGELVGRFVPPQPLKDSEANFVQLQTYYDSGQRLIMAKEFVLASLHNCKANLSQHAKKHNGEMFSLTLDELNDSIRKILLCDNYDSLLMLEAQARKSYYSCYDFMTNSDSFIFGTRSRRPPMNEINAMISFGNTVLYNRLAFLINRSPLDIRIGYLHATTDHRTESLNLDVAEIFKPILVDRVIFTLINKKMIRPDDFEKEENGAVYLTSNGKRIFLRAFYAKLDETITYKGRPYSYDMLLEEEVRKLVRCFRHSEIYVGYRQVS